jgi:hypothetical protein
MEAKTGWAATLYINEINFVDVGFPLDFKGLRLTTAHRNASLDVR